ncbi:hypothetical protein [Acinetobacter wuhouensis]|uniref:Uncharacterized protein n=1 Tax=Acinetobacter wuhouensis TaxID=1879050 RepID=A0A4V2DMN5_9GAMM|nr:hypothetical protein [Acinetobacter wuhouensis]RZG43552.1 hypothetical protein EXU28_17075 [Acinetobacter wuhouensis]RZG70333.1 hypothetical protein EXU29_16530 [Acinetobacter wuhouensis]
MVEQTYNENGNGVAIIKGEPLFEKEKFLIICGGRGQRKHNSGANFLNTARYHIDDIKKNKYPGVPNFDPKTCEIVTPEDIYNKIGYFKHVDPQRPDTWEQDDREEYYIDSKKRKISQYYYSDDVPEKDRDLNWYVLNPKNLNEFIMPLIKSEPMIRKDPKFMKAVDKGEIHRVSDFKKIFNIYKNIKYIAFFGHGWAGEYSGVLYIGDRAAEDTNLFLEDLLGVDVSNVLPDAQIRIFSCRSGFKVGDYFCAAEMFAQIFPGRKAYGWGASGGSIFTHDENFGYTGINKTGKNPNDAIIDSNKKKTWLVANGLPEGWVEYVS